MGIEADIKIGDKLADRFLLIKKLQEGGMGDVYLAFDQKTGKTCVAKIPMHCMHDALFRHEAEVAISLAAINPSAFPEIVAVLTATRDQCEAIIMEYIDGVDLADMFNMNGGRLSPYQTVKIALKILVCLKTAHQQGIIVRDVKPENILISRSGAVKLTDFGLSESNRPESQLNSDGGTSEYIAPEIWDEESYDHRSDLYSFGILLYLMLQGKEPFVAGDDRSPRLLLETDHVLHPPPPMKTDIPKPLQDIVLKLLAKNPEDRFQTAKEVAHALAEYEVGLNPDLRTEEPYYSALGYVTEK